MRESSELQASRWSRSSGRGKGEGKRVGGGRVGVSAWLGWAVSRGGMFRFSGAEVGRLSSFVRSKQILGDHASLLPGAEDLRLLNDDVGVLDKTVSVAARACGDSFCHDGVAPFAYLVKLRFRGNFCRFRCSLAERHALFSSESAELHSDFLEAVGKN